MIIHDWQDLNLQSLDIVLCAGLSKFSKAIYKFQLLTGVLEEEAQITHVAGISGRHSTYVQEATTLNWNGKKGVQANSIEPWLEHYNGKVYVRKLAFERTKKFYRNDWGFWEAHKNDKYENGIPGVLELLLAGFRMHRYVRKVFKNYTPRFTSEPHCTEYDAKRIGEHELWNKVIFPNRMPPHLWVSEIDKWLKCPIGEITRIK